MKRGEERERERSNRGEREKRDVGERSEEMGGGGERGEGKESGKRERGRWGMMGGG